MWKGKMLSVVLPAYNEAENIQQAIRDFLAVRLPDGSPIVDEIVAVDNNSQDGTGALAYQAGARVVTETRQGYGHAIRRGLREASSDLVVIAEPDGTFVPEDLYKLCAYSDEFEMVLGTRTTRALIWQNANMGWFLRIGNLVVAKLLELLYGTCSLSDCGCTFRLIRRDALRRIEPEFHVGGSHFLPNLLIAAAAHHVRFIEIPLNYRSRTGTSKITGNWTGAFKTGLAMIALIITSWPRFILRRRRIPDRPGIPNSANPVVSSPRRQPRLRKPGSEKLPR